MPGINPDNPENHPNEGVFVMKPELREAAQADLAVILPMMEAFYALEHIPFKDSHSRPALERILADPILGRAYLIELDGAVIGYCAVCFGYSLEFGGRDAFVDEIFLLEEHRGKGFGGIVLERVAEEARAHGVVALHLEVERNNAPAKRLYGRSGFEMRDQYFLMSRRLT